MTLALLRHQLRYDLTVQLRDRQSRVFTIGLPIMMVVLFASIFGNSWVIENGASLRQSTYYVANFAAFAVIDSAFMSLAIVLVSQRELGILKRRRATPEPPWVLLLSRALTAAVIAVVMATMLLAFGRFAYGASVPARMLPTLALAIVVGTVSMCALGFAASTLVRRVESAQPVVMAVTLPLFFASGVFIPWQLIPHWLRAVAVVAPVRHLAEAVLLPFTHPAGSAVALRDLGFVALWGVGGLLVAARRFRWSPHQQV
jgi:ABC-2 type transport system permease protein